jgi:predicted N-formylglutamate amidohydrolase
MEIPYSIIGRPAERGLLIVGDHAGNAVPAAINLGIEPDLLGDHIAVDIGVQAVAEQLVMMPDTLAFLGRYSRLVVDLNRAPDDPAAIPEASDGIEIPGNHVTQEARIERISRYHAPYHERLKQLIADLRPALILSLHSFTPIPRSGDDTARPWDFGILYNEYAAASRIAIAWLEDQGFCVGDQLPYSGKQFHATMDRHAEAGGWPYLGIEMRQDLVVDAIGQQRMAGILTKLLNHLRNALA